MEIYLIVDTGNAPGRVYGAFASEEDAKDCIDQGIFLGYKLAEDCEIIPVKLRYGQTQFAALFEPEKPKCRKLRNRK